MAGSWGAIVATLLESLKEREGGREAEGIGVESWSSANGLEGASELEVRVPKVYFGLLVISLKG